MKPELKAIYARMAKGKPYTDEGAYTMKYRGPGVYIIYKRHTVNFPAVAVYVGYSSTDLQNTMYRHFQKWNDRRASGQVERVVYTDRENITIAWLECETKEEAYHIETLLINELKPVDNTDYKSLSAAAHFIAPQEHEQPESPGWTPYITDDFSF